MRATPLNFRWNLQRIRPKIAGSVHESRFTRTHTLDSPRFRTIVNAACYFCVHGGGRQRSFLSMIYIIWTFVNALCFFYDDGFVFGWRSACRMNALFFSKKKTSLTFGFKSHFGEHYLHFAELNLPCMDLSKNFKFEFKSLLEIGM